MNTYNHTKKNEDQPISNSHAKPLVTGKSALQFQDNRSRSIIQKKNSTGLPDQLKSGIENLSGHSMDDVKVHYNSDKPAQLSAHAYAQGTDIHIAPGQEKHLPHEAWHVVQQKQGRVKPTVQMKRKVNVNDDKRLEDEADMMGAKIMQRVAISKTATKLSSSFYSTNVIQAKQFFEDNLHSGKEDAFYNHQLVVLNTAMKAAVDGLPNNATTAAAQDAMQAIFGGHAAVPAGHVLNFTGTSVFVDTAAGVHVDRLGTLTDDQDASMYLQVPAAVGDVNTLWVNKSSGQQYVRDTNNLFTPRFQSRSITMGDRGRINNRTSIQGSNPGGAATPLQHVGGMPSPYISMSAGLADVTNAHGVFFNAANAAGQQKGRVEADMLQVPQGDIVDLHATTGATRELGQHMAPNIRANFPAIWNQAHTQIGNIDAAAPGAKVAAHTTASGNRPATMNAGQNMAWQQLLDAVRTKEVLVHQNLPFAAITSFSNSVGHPALAAATTAAIAANAARSQVRTVAATIALTTHQQPAALSAQIVTALQAGKNRSKAAFKAAARLAILPLATDQRGTRYAAFNNAGDNTNANLDEMAHLYQQRISGEVYGAGAAGVTAGVAAFIIEANAKIAADVAAM